VYRFVKGLRRGNLFLQKTLIAGRILFIGAHCDDIEIGCGGTAAKFAATRHSIAFAIATRVTDDTKAETRRNEAVKSAALLGLSQDSKNLFFGSILDGELNQKQKELREWLKMLSITFQPDTVFVHRADEHSDHEAICEVSKGVFGDKNVLLYYIPRQAPDVPFAGSCGVAISDFIETKVSMCECHSSQRAIYISRDAVITNAHSCYIRWFGAAQMRADGYAEEYILRAWRSPIEPILPQLESGIPSVPDDLRLLRKADGTFHWDD
jgi:LmbE family N-acetylglucosaminyl deacetylase